jgi:hypothetical protein
MLIKSKQINANEDAIVEEAMADFDAEWEAVAPVWTAEHALVSA